MATVQLTEKDIKKKAEKDIKSLEKIEGQVSELQAALSENPQFQQFLQFQEQFKTKSNEVFKKLETQMIDNGVEKISWDDGSYIRITERTSYKVADEELVPEEYKETQVVVNMAAVKEDIELTDQIPDGIIKQTSKFLQKKINAVKGIS